MPAAGDDVDVEMGDTLADPIVHGDEASFRRHSLFRRAGQKTDAAEERGDQFIGEVRQGCNVNPGHQEHVPRKERAVVEKRQRNVIGVNYLCLCVLPAMISQNRHVATCFVPSRAESAGSAPTVPAA